MVLVVAASPDGPSFLAVQHIVDVKYAEPSHRSLLKIPSDCHRLTIKSIQFASGCFQVAIAVVVIQGIFDRKVPRGSNVQTNAIQIVPTLPSVILVPVTVVRFSHSPSPLPSINVVKIKYKYLIYHIYNMQRQLGE